MSGKARLELLRLFELDALDLVNSQKRSKVIHASKDLSASGDEVEIMFREILKRRLPTRNYVGHGHIVDKTLSSSPQFDVVIADNTNAPILFRTQKGSEYFPYESVYAVGEVKSTYYKNKRPIETFVENVAHTKASLTRETTPPNDTGIGISSSMPLTQYPYRNPFFNFIFFVESNDFRLEDIREFFLSTNTADLPNTICFLDKGLIINTRISYKSTGELTTGHINIIPEFSETTDTVENRFMFCPSNDKKYRKGSHLSNLFYVILAHLSECKLRPAAILSYLESMMEFKDMKMIDWEPSLNVFALRAKVIDSEVEETPDIQNARRFLEIYDASDSKNELVDQLNKKLSEK